MRRALAIVALLASACAPGTFIAGAGDYGLYRETRVGKTFEERLFAADEYLHRYPDGAWAEEVRAYYDTAEPLYFASKEKSIGGLEAYIATLPRGRHTARAKKVLVELRAAKVKDREDYAGTAAAATARIEEREKAQARVRQEIGAWIERFLDREVFARPMRDADARLLVPWAVALPLPACALDDADTTGAYRCSKILRLPFTVISSGVPEDREATVEIAVRFDEAGRPIGASVGGPDLFIRLEEAKQRKGVELDDPEARVDAVAGAVAMVRELFGAKVGKDKACDGSPVAPVVLDLACHGLRAVAKVGAPGEDDLVVITPVAAKGE